MASKISQINIYKEKNVYLLETLYKFVWYTAIIPALKGLSQGYFDFTKTEQNNTKPSKQCKTKKVKQETMPVSIAQWKSIY